ncbi:suppressor of fused homolog [Strongylocentrotus purpuratus]|uniref:Suppressor of fused homolog n=1 Tax=Strongylocentrotus purpuratus TaxID=7668 RepID=A0A7M7RGA8_STRPU|nr:suppressor of fused homolog [Strongylocentrotus purpuratus]|eukprot:XP_796446.2 PREDICTED: suppressor of fused homolog [Strongylocentrotus purpuratus]
MEQQQREAEHGTAPVPALPGGLDAVYTACRRLYVDQPNPLQVTAVLKYWLNGPDPLDFISMYSNPGEPGHGIPPHWHYVSFGLSDLFGDGRVHEIPTGPNGPSGFGFELTFRLKKEPTETAPPTWPAELMQGLARYVFQSGNTLCNGDHVSWHSPLDNSESRIQHMLMADDSQLPTITTPHGTVSFVQIVGVCSEELQASQRWNGLGMLDLLKSMEVAGGSWLVTDMRRGETIFEVNPLLMEEVERGIDTEGSNLSGVCARCSWDPVGDWTDETDTPRISQIETEQIRQALTRGLSNDKPILPPISGKQGEEDTSQGLNRRPSTESETDTRSSIFELGNSRYLDGVSIKLNLEAAALLSLAVRGRLTHGRHFTFKNVANDCAITLVSPSVEGSFVEENHPFVAKGPWLQLLIRSDFAETMANDLEFLQSTENLELPKVIDWRDNKLTLTITPDET